jgi:outer membrane protein assembly factor BamB
LSGASTIAEAGDPETNPLVIGRTLYAFTPSLKLMALNGATGKRLWTFDSGIPGSGPDRGLAYWTDGKHRRLLAGVMNYLYAIDPDYGQTGRRLRRTRPDRSAAEPDRRSNAILRLTDFPGDDLQGCDHRGVSDL